MQLHSIPIAVSGHGHTKRKNKQTFEGVIQMQQITPKVSKSLSQAVLSRIHLTMRLAEHLTALCA